MRGFVRATRGSTDRPPSDLATLVGVRIALLQPGEVTHGLVDALGQLRVSLVGALEPLAQFGRNHSPSGRVLLACERVQALAVQQLHLCLGDLARNAKKGGTSAAPHALWVPGKGVVVTQFPPWCAQLITTGDLTCVVRVPVAGTELVHGHHPARVRGSGLTYQ